MTRTSAQPRSATGSRRCADGCGPAQPVVDRRRRDRTVAGGDGKLVERAHDVARGVQAAHAGLATSSDELAPDQRFASHQLVEHLLAALKPVERLAIDLLYLQGRSVDEIRKITGWSAALVKVRAFRARQKMKQQLAKISEKEKQ